MQVRGFRQQLSAHEAEFAKRNPDYFDRINAYVDWKAKELAAVEGYDERALPSLRQHFQADLFRRAYTLANRGVDPADHFYRALAGWAPQKSPAEEGADQPAQPAKPAAEDKFTSLKGGSGAGDARAPRSATDLLKMSDDEFAKAVENGTFKKVAAR